MTSGLDQTDPAAESSCRSESRVSVPRSRAGFGREVRGVMRVISKLNECTPYNLSKCGEIYTGGQKCGKFVSFADMAVSLSPIRVYKIPNFPNLGLLRPFLARQGGTREMVTGWGRGTGPI